MFGVVHRPDDDDLLQALGRGGLRNAVDVVLVLGHDLGVLGWGGRRSQLLHQSVEGVRVDGLLLVGVGVGFKGHLVGGAHRGLRGLLDDAVSGGSVGISTSVSCGGR